jgi:hypothetical protein
MQDKQQLRQGSNWPFYPHAGMMTMNWWTLRVFGRILTKNAQGRKTCRYNADMPNWSDRSKAPGRRPGQTW